jgi:hypothetical protein
MAATFFASLKVKSYITTAVEQHVPIESTFLVSILNYIHWSQAQNVLMVFLGFIGVMASRLYISTVLPPTSPIFAALVALATPEGQHWITMPLFLLASTIVGALPTLFDKMIMLVTRQDFVYSNAAKRFSEYWPLTCWTVPTMMAVFKQFGGGKVGASVAVVFAHAAPFMGAQTTQLQRCFLPSPWDTIFSQPFGMSEDLLTIALVSALSDPFFSSLSLTILMVGFNVFQTFFKETDRPAYYIAVSNFVVGAVIGCIVKLWDMPPNHLWMLALVALQACCQLFLCPLLVTQSVEEVIRRTPEP